MKVGDKVITLDPAGYINCGERGVIEEIRSYTLNTGKTHKICIVYLVDIQNTAIYIPSELKVIEDNKTMQKFYVETEGENHSQILQELAFDEGYSWYSDSLNQKTKVQYTGNKYLFFIPKDKDICKSNSRNENLRYQQLKNYSIKEFKQALNGEYFNNIPDIKLYGYDVKFYNTCIKVGCRTYTINEIEDVVNVLFGKTLNFDINLEFQLVETTENNTVPKNKIKQIAEYYDLL